jgi:ADP-ribose pyrophosphatase YjhB (NUDIX family)
LFFLFTFKTKQGYMTEKTKYSWIETAKRLQTIAQAGLEFCHNEYDRDRYLQLRDIAFDILEHHSDHEREEIIGFFKDDNGYPTPKVDVRAVIFKEGKILLIREKLDGKWSLPGGWADPHLSIRENLIKESMEEAGVEVVPENLLFVHDRAKRNYPPIPHGCYKLFVECKLISGEFQANTETSESGYFRLSELPELSTPRNTVEQIQLCFEKRGGKNPVEFD